MNDNAHSFFETTKNTSTHSFPWKIDDFVTVLGEPQGIEGMIKDVMGPSGAVHLRFGKPYEIQCFGGQPADQLLGIATGSLTLRAPSGTRLVAPGSVTMIPATAPYVLEVGPNGCLYGIGFCSPQPVQRDIA